MARLQLRRSSQWSKNLILRRLRNTQSVGWKIWKWTGLLLGILKKRMPWKLWWTLRVHWITDISVKKHVNLLGASYCKKIQYIKLTKKTNLKKAKTMRSVSFLIWVEKMMIHNKGLSITWWPHLFMSPASRYSGLKNNLATQ